MRKAHRKIPEIHDLATKPDDLSYDARTRRIGHSRQSEVTQLDAMSDLLR